MGWPHSTRAEHRENQCGGADRPRPVLYDGRGFALALVALPARSERSGYPDQWWNTEGGRPRAVVSRAGTAYAVGPSGQDSAD